MATDRVSALQEDNYSLNVKLALLAELMLKSTNANLHLVAQKTWDSIPYACRMTASKISRQGLIESYIEV